jgi:TorA maturation chaperone TorD
MEHDYVRLFVNAKGGMRANPYASCYFGEEKLLWGAEMVRLKELMASEGFKMGEGVAELEDHVGIVMEFCSALLEKIAGCRDDQCGIGSCFAFLEISKDFFPVFAGEFADKVVLGAELEYYKNAALLLKSFLYEAEELFEELLFDSAS